MKILSFFDANVAVVSMIFQWSLFKFDVSRYSQLKIKVDGCGCPSERVPRASLTKEGVEDNYNL